MTAPASNSQYTGSLKGDADTISAPTYAYQVQESYTPPNGAPLGRTQTIMMPAFGGAFQPAPYKQSFRKFANPAPLGLCAFALTTFVLSMANANASGVKSPSIAIGAAYAYGGFVQLLAGMWEMAVGSKITDCPRVSLPRSKLTFFRHFWCNCIVVFWWFLDRLGTHRDRGTGPHGALCQCLRVELCRRLLPRWVCLPLPST